MAFDEACFSAKVVSWSQTVTHGETYPQYQFTVSAHIIGDDDLVFDADGHRNLADMRMHLTLLRGRPEKLPERGVGTLAYHGEFVGGWFWLPEALYDEIWGQARENRYDACVIELQFVPVEAAERALRGDNSTNKIAPITQAGVRFERKPLPPINLNASLPTSPKKRGFLAWGKQYFLGNIPR